jgi:UDP-N-acetylmuramate dehydrogenase
MKENVSLADTTTLKVGGEARYFFEALTEEDIVRASAFAAERKLPIFVLGGGSNILFSDAGFPGVVIRIKTQDISYEDHGGAALGRATAGVSWDAFVADAVSRGLWGVENLSGIPGTVGAAPIQNIGAYGAEIKDIVESVRALDMRTGEEKIFSNADCRFEYRDSFFKTEEGRHFIVLEVTFRLSKEPKPNISYKDLKEYGFSELSPQSIRSAVLEIRSKKFPDLSKVGTAGSFFKNPIISQTHFDTLKKKYPELPFFAAKNGVKVPLAFILDKVCDLKGFAKGPVGLFQNQPLVLVNTGGATAKEIRDFVAGIKKIVKDKTGIDIEEEVVCMP